MSRHLFFTSSISQTLSFPFYREIALIYDKSSPVLSATLCVDMPIIARCKRVLEQDNRFFEGVLSNSVVIVVYARKVCRRIQLIQPISPCDCVFRHFRTSQHCRRATLANTASTDAIGLAILLSNTHIVVVIVFEARHRTQSYLSTLSVKRVLGQSRYRPFSQLSSVNWVMAHCSFRHYCC